MSKAESPLDHCCMMYDALQLLFSVTDHRDMLLQLINMMWYHSWVFLANCKHHSAIKSGHIYVDAWSFMFCIFTT